VKYLLKTISCFDEQPSCPEEARRTRIAKLAAESHVPAIYAVKEFAEAGGLMTYGSMFTRAFGAPPATWTSS